MMNEFTADGIAALRQQAAQHVGITVVEETGSTNADLLAALPHLQTPSFLIARSQTAGRGRAGRSWHSVAGKSLTFSLAWKFDAPPLTLLGLPLAVGVALADALATFQIDVRLKWPNDVLYQGRKLAGVLIESAAAGPRASWAVIGVGINMHVDGGGLDRPVANIPWLVELDQNMLVATLLNNLARALDVFGREGLAAFTARWNALHAYRGQTVRILDNGAVLHEGIAVGIDVDGRFLLDTAQGRIAVVAGDVSLRVKED